MNMITSLLVFGVPVVVLAVRTLRLEANPNFNQEEKQCILFLKKKLDTFHSKDWSVRKKFLEEHVSVWKIEELGLEKASQNKRDELYVLHALRRATTFKE